LICLFDASTTINLLNGELFDKIISQDDRAWAIGPVCLEECAKDDGQAGETLRRLVAEKRLVQLDDSKLSAVRYAAILEEHGLGEGESECLAFAELDSDMVVLCDDKRARAVLSRQLGAVRVSGSLGLLKNAVASGSLAAEAAMDAYLKMRSAGGFLPDIPDAYFAIRMHS
jgi:predicted nucleic acid-binding protein